MEEELSGRRGMKGKEEVIRPRSKDMRFKACESRRGREDARPDPRRSRVRGVGKNTAVT